MDHGPKAFQGELSPLSLDDFIISCTCISLINWTSPLLKNGY